MKKILAITLLFLFFTSAVYAENLELDTQQAKQGENVTFTVSVNSAPNAVSAFGFDILFDAAILEYQNFEKGSLVQKGFAMFDVNEVESGKLRVGGLDFGGNPIPQGSSASLILLTFKVIGNTGSVLTIKELKDDVKSWSMKNGVFEIFPPIPAPDENTPPSADSKNISVSEGKTAEIQLNGTDPEGDSLTYFLLSYPGHGKLEGNPPDLVYTPDENFSGTDSFSYKVSDGENDSSPATVFITVNEISPELSVGVSERTMNLAWTPVSGAAGYYLYYAPFPEMSPVNFIDMKNLTDISAQLPPGYAYYVAVQAYDESGGMGFSDVLSFMIPPVLDPPELTVNTDGSNVSLSWTETEGAEGYMLYYAPYPSASAVYSGDMGNMTSLSGELPADSAFYVIVQAYNAEGRSGYSNLEYFILEK